MFGAWTVGRSTERNVLRDCHSAGTPSSSLPKRLRKEEGGTAE